MTCTISHMCDRCLMNLMKLARVVNMHKTKAALLPATQLAVNNNQESDSAAGGQATSSLQIAHHCGKDEEILWKAEQPVHHSVSSHQTTKVSCLQSPVRSSTFNYTAPLSCSCSCAALTLRHVLDCWQPFMQVADLPLAWRLFPILFGSSLLSQPYASPAVRKRSADPDPCCPRQLQQQPLPPPIKLTLRLQGPSNTGILAVPPRSRTPQPGSPTAPCPNCST